MAHLIDKDAVMAIIKKHRSRVVGIPGHFNESSLCNKILVDIDTLEVKEVDEQKERMSECPYRQVGCTMYEGKILECNGACSWVVDYPRLKELKTQKGEEV